MLHSIRDSRWRATTQVTCTRWRGHFWGKPYNARWFMAEEAKLWLLCLCSEQSAPFLYTLHFLCELLFRLTFEYFSSCLASTFATPRDCNVCIALATNRIGWSMWIGPFKPVSTKMWPSVWYRVVTRLDLHHRYRSKMIFRYRKTVTRYNFKAIKCNDRLDVTGLPKIYVFFKPGKFVN